MPMEYGRVSAFHMQNVAKQIIEQCNVVNSEE